MGFWAISFELMIGLLFIINLFLYIQQKKWQYLCELIAGSLYGVMLEFIQVYTSNDYHYSTTFLIQIGISPCNIPVVIGLAWGMIILSTIEIADRFLLSKFGKTLMGAFLGLSIDIAMDIVAIRLEGGFWNWSSIEKNSTINAAGFLGVNWGNYLGWFLIVFIFTLLIRFEREKITENEYKKQFFFMIISPVIATIILAIMLYIPSQIYSLITISMGENKPNVGWVSIIYLIVLFTIGIGYFGYLFVNKKFKKVEKPLKNWFPTLFFTYSHLNYLIATFVAGLYTEIGFFVPVSITIFFISLSIDLFSQKSEIKVPLMAIELSSIQKSKNPV